MTNNPLIHELPADTLDSAYKALESIRHSIHEDDESDVNHGYYLLLGCIASAIGDARDRVVDS